MIEFSDGRYRVRGPVTLATVQPLLEEGVQRFDRRRGACRSVRSDRRRFRGGGATARLDACRRARTPHPFRESDRESESLIDLTSSGSSAARMIRFTGCDAPRHVATRDSAFTPSRVRAQRIA